MIRETPTILLDYLTTGYLTTHYLTTFNINQKSYFYE